MESVSKKNDRKNEAVVVVEDHGEKARKSKNLESNLKVATRELDVAGSSKHPRSNRIFSCKYCGKEFSSSRALGGHHNAHRPPEGGPMRKAFLRPTYPGLPYRLHLVHSSSQMSSSTIISPSQTDLGRASEMLKMNSSMTKMLCSPWPTLRHHHGGHVGGWPSHSSPSTSLVVQNNIDSSSQLPIDDNISISSTGTHSNFGENIGGRVSPTIAIGISLTTNSIEGNNIINQQFNGDHNILKSTGGHVAEARGNMQEVLEQGLDLTLKL